MPSPVVDSVVNEANQDVTVMEGATTVINGISGMVQTAVDQALANGATAEQLQPVSDVIAVLAEKRAALATAIANVPPGATARKG